MRTASGCRQPPQCQGAFRQRVTKTLIPPLEVPKMSDAASARSHSPRVTAEHKDSSRGTESLHCGRKHWEDLLEDGAAEALSFSLSSCLFQYLRSFFIYFSVVFIFSLAFDVFLSFPVFCSRVVCFSSFSLFLFSFFVFVVFSLFSSLFSFFLFFNRFISFFSAFQHVLSMLSIFVLLSSFFETKNISSPKKLQKLRKK